jgi:hypothetical protein
MRNVPSYCSKSWKKYFWGAPGTEETNQETRTRRRSQKKRTKDRVRLSSRIAGGDAARWALRPLKVRLCSTEVRAITGAS